MSGFGQFQSDCPYCFIIMRPQANSIQAIQLVYADPIDKRSPFRTDSINSSNVNSPLPKFFLTSSSAQKDMWGQGYQNVIELHKELDNMVDGLGSKINSVIDRSQSQFLIAYRNHMKRIRKQLQQMRAKLQIHQNQTSVQKVNVLEKQLRLFRQESLMMYDKLEAKNKQCDQIAIKLQQLKDQNLFLQNQAKKLMKINKLQQIQANKLKQAQPDVNNSTFECRPEQVMSRVRTSTFTGKNRTNSSKMSNRIKEICTNKDVPAEVNNYINHMIHNKERRISDLQSKCKFNTSTIVGLRAQSQLQAFFLECVQTVRKDIYKKQNQAGIGRIDNTSFDKFKTLDKIKVLSLFTNNDSVLRILYEEVFRKVQEPKPRYFSRLQSRGERRQISTLLD